MNQKTIRKKSLILVFTSVSLLLAVIVLSILDIDKNNKNIFTHSSAAQTNPSVVPTFYCGGSNNCVSGNPTLPMPPSGNNLNGVPSTIPSAVPSAVVPSTAVSAAPSQAPCVQGVTSSTQSFFNSGGSFLRVGRSWFGGGNWFGGGIGGFFQQFFNLLIELLKQLLPLIGGGNGNTNPIVNPGNPSTTPAMPCNPTTTSMPMPTVSATNSPTQAITTQPTPSPTAPVKATAAPVATNHCTQADIQKLVASVSQANIQADERELVQDDSKPKPNELISRWIGVPGNQVKVDWMKQILTGYGLQTTEQPFNADGYNQNNVVGTLSGSNPNAIYIVSGHIDGDSEQHNTWAEAADDDASGVAVTIEAARVLKTFQACLKSTVQFVGYNDEEFSMKGGPTYIQNLGGKTLKGEFDLDQVGYKVGEADCVDSYYNSSQDQPLAQKLANMNTKYAIGLSMPVATYYSANDTDASSFWAAGLPAVMNEECDKGLTTEMTTDTIENINFSQLTKDAKVIVAGLAELASQ